jgi:steroid 5-alpha reductase family enzyme
MIRTIILLIGCLLVLPFVAFRYDTPLSIEQVSALHTAIYMMIGVALTCFVVSEITRNCSQVDKIWSIVPLVYVWYFAIASDFNARLVLMSVLVTLWGARLTYNFGRRGGYHWIPWKGEEDYRWSVLRQRPFLDTRGGWALFNLTFISLYQNGLILLFTLPIVVAWQGGAEPLGVFDIIIALIFIGLIVFETIADQQQYDFQTEKHRRIKNNEPLTDEQKKGFCSTGLWAKMRHPNYFAEQAIWLTFYFFSVSATGRWLNWSLAGAILLMLLFLGSSDYQERVPRFLPKF